MTQPCFALGLFPTARSRPRTSVCRKSSRTQVVKSIDYSVYLVADPSVRRPSGLSLPAAVDAAIRGGASIVQLRHKEGSTRDVVALASKLRIITRKHHVPFLINDRLDVALAVCADGVHLGQDDMPVPVARRLLPRGALVGVSASDAAEARAAQEEGADYLGVGAVYATASKGDAGAPIGAHGLMDVAEATTLPVVAIGGVSAENASPCALSGASGVAVISAILSADDPHAATRHLREQFSAPVGA